VPRSVSASSNRKCGISLVKNQAQTNQSLKKMRSETDFFSTTRQSETKTISSVIKLGSNKNINSISSLTIQKNNGTIKIIPVQSPMNQY
jgi:hypothetical protein